MLLKYKCARSSFAQRYPSLDHASIWQPRRRSNINNERHLISSSKNVVIGLTEMGTIDIAMIPLASESQSGMRNVTFPQSSIGVKCEASSLSGRRGWRARRASRTGGQAGRVLSAFRANWLTVSEIVIELQHVRGVEH